MVLASQKWLKAQFFFSNIWVYIAEHLIKTATNHEHSVIIPTNNFKRYIRKYIQRPTGQTPPSCNSLQELKKPSNSDDKDNPN